MLQRRIASVILGGALLIGLAGVAGSAGTAFAGVSAPTTTSAPAHTGAQVAKAQAHAWLKGHRKSIRKAAIAISATTIGISPLALVVELKSGKSIAQVATAHLVDPQLVVDALTAAAQVKVAHAVTAGKLSQSKADAINSGLPGRIAKVVNHVF
ncbi:MAG: hypothetical protein WCI26_09025 [Acidimicrobiales bacterium]